jgi:hypothetical protein
VYYKVMYNKAPYLVRSINVNYEPVQLAD